MNDNCAYCVEGDLLAEFGIKIRELKASKVYLFKEQSHRGRVIVASKFHVSEIVDLSERDRRAFLDDVATVSAALHRVFKPQKINYGAYGDTGCHLHFHLVPKYADDPFEWGGVFAMNPKRTYLKDEEYADMIARISAALLAGTGADMRQALETLRREIADDGRVDYVESTMLLEMLRPLAAGDQRVTDLVALLQTVRADGAVSAEESAALLAALDRLLV